MCVSATAPDDGAGRRPSQRDRILDLLRERGSAGATNVELNAICYRYGGRLFELRKKCGFTIRTESLGGGLFKFYLIAEPPTVTE
jgi:Helix-turn-helix domain